MTLTRLPVCHCVSLQRSIRTISAKRSLISDVCRASRLQQTYAQREAFSETPRPATIPCLHLWNKSLHGQVRLYSMSLYKVWQRSTGGWLRVEEEKCQASLCSLREALALPFTHLEWGTQREKKTENVSPPLLNRKVSMSARLFGFFCHKRLIRVSKTNRYRTLIEEQDVPLHAHDENESRDASGDIKTRAELKFNSRGGYKLWLQFHCNLFVRITKQKK